MDSRDSNVTPPVESPSPETATPAASAEDAAEPVLRVTTPAPSQLSKLKNEKKAAAGRAGAAARKAKSDRLERELAAAKEALRDPAFVADPPAAHSNEEAAPQRDKKEEGPALFTWPVGVLVAAAGALAYWSHRAESSLPPRPLPEKKPPVLQNSEGPAQQLKVAHNPHYME